MALSQLQSQFSGCVQLVLVQSMHGMQVDLVNLAATCSAATACWCHGEGCDKPRPRQFSRVQMIFVDPTWQQIRGHKQTQAPCLPGRN